MEASAPAMEYFPATSVPTIDKDLEKCLQMFATQTAFTISSCRTPDMPIVYASPHFCTLTGYSPREVVGRNCRFLQGPGTSRQSVLEVRNSIQEDRGCAVCLLNYTKDGKPFWNQLCLSPIRDQHGVAFYLGIQTNVTGPVLAYRSQHFSPFQIAAPAGPHGGVHSFEGCGDVIAKEADIAQRMGHTIQDWHTRNLQGRVPTRTDFRPVSCTRLPVSLLNPLYKLQHSFVLADPNLPDMPIVHASEGFLKLTGRPRDQVVGHNCRFMQGPQTDRAEVARLKEAIAEQRPVTVRLLNYRQDGTKFWNNLHVAPIRNADGEVVFYVGVQLDITLRDAPPAEKAAAPEPAAKPVAAGQPAPGVGGTPPGGTPSAGEQPTPKAKDPNPTTAPQNADGKGGPQSTEGKAAGHSPAAAAKEARSLLANLDLLSRGTAEGREGVRGKAAGGDGEMPRAKETLGPREKQLQRSVVGTVRVVCRSLSASLSQKGLGLRRSLEDQHRPHADECVPPKDSQDMSTQSGSHL